MYIGSKILYVVNIVKNVRDIKGLNIGKFYKLAKQIKMDIMIDMGMWEIMTKMVTMQRSYWPK